MAQRLHFVMTLILVGLVASLTYVCFELQGDVHALRASSDQSVPEQAGPIDWVKLMTVTGTPPNIARKDLLPSPIPAPLLAEIVRSNCVAAFLGLLEEPRIPGPEMQKLIMSRC